MRRFSLLGCLVALLCLSACGGRGYWRSDDYRDRLFAATQQTLGERFRLLKADAENYEFEAVSEPFSYGGALMRTRVRACMTRDIDGNWDVEVRARDELETSSMGDKPGGDQKPYKWRPASANRRQEAVLLRNIHRIADSLKNEAAEVDT